MDQAKIWDALQQTSTRNKPEQRSFDSFEDAVFSVVDQSEDQACNVHDLLCPRTACGSIILKKGVAKYVEQRAVQMEPSDSPQHPLLSSLPTDSHSSWWLITPSPMQFENIGFSRPAEALPLSPSGKKLKLLACAECDFGPLGWSEEGGTEFWLACGRVGYRVCE